MKNKLLLVALSKLLKVDQSVIEAESQKEDGNDSIVKSWLEKHNSYTAEELATLINNSNKQYLEKADFELTQVPKPLYSKIAAAALESKEKHLAKEYGVTEYKDLQDLLGKIAESTKGKGVDETLKQQIETLKGTIKSLEQEKEKVVNDVRSQYENEFIDRDFNSALLQLNLDYDDEVKEKQRKLLTSAFNSEYKVERKDKKNIVLDKSGKPITNKLGDPEQISNVLKTFASEYGFKIKTEDTGGRGSSSSTQSGTSLKGKSFDEFIAEKGVQPHTEESDKLFVEWKAAQN